MLQDDLISRERTIIRAFRDATADRINRESQAEHSRVDGINSENEDYVKVLETASNLLAKSNYNLSQAQAAVRIAPGLILKESKTNTDIGTKVIYQDLASNVAHSSELLLRLQELTRVYEVELKSLYEQYERQQETLATQQERKKLIKILRISSVVPICIGTWVLLSSRISTTPITNEWFIAIAGFLLNIFLLTAVMNLRPVWTQLLKTQTISNQMLAIAWGAIAGGSLGLFIHRAWLYYSIPMPFGSEPYIPIIKQGIEPISFWGLITGAFVGGLVSYVLLRWEMDLLSKVVEIFLFGALYGAMSFWFIIVGAAFISGDALLFFAGASVVCLGVLGGISLFLFLRSFVAPNQPESKEKYHHPTNNSDDILRRVVVFGILGYIALLGVVWFFQLGWPISLQFLSSVFGLGMGVSWSIAYIAFQFPTTIPISE